MSQGLVANEVLVASPGLSSILSQNREQNMTRQSTGWSDAQGHGANNMESNESFDPSLGSTLRLDDSELRIGGFTYRDGLMDADHWSRFTSRGAQTSSQALPNFSFNAVSVSPDARLSITPPHSLPDSSRGPASDPLHGHLSESFQSVLHGPVPTFRARHVPDARGADATFPSFGNTREDGLWLKNPDEFEGNKPLELHLPYPLVGGSNTNPSGLSSLSTSSALPLLEHTYVQQQYHPGIFPHNHPFSGTDRTFFKPTQLTPPPTASTSSSSSGSSSPFTRSDVVETTTHKDTTWKHFDANANVFRTAPRHSADHFASKMTRSAPHATQEWKTETCCDPRGIIGKRERDDSCMHSNAYGNTMRPVPSHSPAISDLSGSSTSGEHGEAAALYPRHPNLGHGTNPFGLLPLPSKDRGGSTDMRVGIAHKAKKKSGEEMLGMGLEDVDERELQFTSRQDTKPTRMLRRQCFNCRTWRDVSAWRRSIMQVGYIVCNKCGLYEKAHRKQRPLNDRGEFIRPGKHVTKLSAARGRGRMRSISEHSNGLSVAVMRFDEDGPASAHQV